MLSDIAWSKIINRYTYELSIISTETKHRQYTSYSYHLEASSLLVVHKKIPLATFKISPTKIRVLFAKYPNSNISNALPSIKESWGRNEIQTSIPYILAALRGFNSRQFYPVDRTMSLPFARL